MDLEMCETISIYNNRFCRVFRPEVDSIYNSNTDTLHFSMYNSKNKSLTN